MAPMYFNQVVNITNLRLLSTLLLLALSVSQVACRREQGGGIAGGSDSGQFSYFKNFVVDDLGNAGYGASILVEQNAEAGAVAFTVKTEQGHTLQLLEWQVDNSGDFRKTVRQIAEQTGENVKLIKTTAGRYIVGSIIHNELERSLVLFAENKDWQPIDLDIEGDVGAYLDATVDTSQAIHIAYLESGGGDLRYLVWQDDVFLVTPEIADTGFDSGQIGPGGDIDFTVSLCLNNSQEPFVSYYDATNARLRVARRSFESQAWLIDVVGQYHEGEVLVVNTNGIASPQNRFITRSQQINLYQNGTLLPDESYSILSDSEILISNHDKNAEYQIDYVEPASPDYGSWSSIACKIDGGVVVSYYDFRRGSLVVGSNLSPSATTKWHLEYVDKLGIVGDFNQLKLMPVIDKNGVLRGQAAVVVYQDVGNGDLKLATNLSGSWDTYRLDVAGLTGFNPSLALSSSGYAAIAYRSLTPSTFSSQLHIIRALLTGR